MTKTDIINNVKILLDLGVEYEPVLGVQYDLSLYKNLKLCNRTEEELLTDPLLGQLITYDLCVIFNKRFKEGIQTENTAGFSTTYGYERMYKDMLVACNRIKVVGSNEIL